MPARAEPIIIESTCGGRSPAIDGIRDELRFSCQRPADHKGDHRLVLEWRSGEDEELFPRAPWRGIK